MYGVECNARWLWVVNMEGCVRDLYQGYNDHIQKDYMGDIYV
jgi:hypothetical protein